jgi:hypothetical protein
MTPMLTANPLDQQGLVLGQNLGGGTARMRSLNMATSFVPDATQNGSPLVSSQARISTQWKIVKPI